MDLIYYYVLFLWNVSIIVHNHFVKTKWNILQLTVGAVHSVSVFTLKKS